MLNKLLVPSSFHCIERAAFIKVELHVFVLFLYEMGKNSLYIKICFLSVVVRHVFTYAQIDFGEWLCSRDLFALGSTQT